MALFQRRPQTSDPTNYYTVGMNKTVLLVGLGNPGAKYDLTRHNVGFLCIDEFVAKTEEMGDWVDNKKLKCHLSRGEINGLSVLAVKPMTFMNDSGQGVQAVANFYKIHPDQVVAVHDELDIDFGQIRTRVGGSDAGHNGVKSVTQQIGEGYGRIRIGIGPKQPAQINSEDFVLQKFSKDQQAELPNLTKEVIAIFSEYLYGDQKLPHETRSFLV